MKNRNRLLLAVAMVALAVSGSACVSAGYGYGDDRRPGYGYPDIGRVAYDNGYRQGLSNGEREARSGRRPDYRNDRDYRDADWGWDRRMGPRGQYRQVFRDGYQAGYMDAFRRYADTGRYGSGRATPRYGDRDSPRGGYGNYGGYANNNPAFRNGYEDGLDKGAKDARDRRAFDYLRHEWYREGDRQYDSRYGSRQQYKDVYREGFKQGYEAGYRGRR
jgi:hypothetical protein